MRKKQIIIALVGLYSAGKDTVADYLSQQGFVHTSLSDILREICRKRGTYRGRDDLIRVGNELRKRYGPGYLAKKAMQRALKSKNDKIILSSIRSPYEIQALKQQGTVFVVAVTAPLAIRFRRAKKRGKLDDRVTLATFRAQERSERTGSKNQQQLDKVMGMADYSIDNSKDLTSLFKKVDKAVNDIKKRIGIIKNIVLLGPQGSGKGTQAQILSDTFALGHIETGKIFRSISKKTTPLGRKVNRLINIEGGLVPTSVVIRILKQELKKLPAGKGVVFDGYPRNLSQAKALDSMLRSLKRDLSHVIYLPISKATTIKRLSKRRTCRRCGRVFIAGTTIAKGRKKCPRCGGEIYQREDDQPRAIANRLAVYNRLTKPLIAYYRKKELLITVNGEPPIPVVTKKILTLVS